MISPTSPTSSRYNEVSNSNSGSIKQNKDKGKGKVKDAKSTIISLVSNVLAPKKDTSLSLSGSKHYSITNNNNNNNNDNLNNSDSTFNSDSAFYSYSSSSSFYPEGSPSSSTSPAISPPGSPTSSHQTLPECQTLDPTKTNLENASSSTSPPTSRKKGSNPKTLEMMQKKFNTLDTIITGLKSSFERTFDLTNHQTNTKIISMAERCKYGQTLFTEIWFIIDLYNFSNGLSDEENSKSKKPCYQFFDSATFYPEQVKPSYIEKMNRKFSDLLLNFKEGLCTMHNRSLLIFLLKKEDEEELKKLAKLEKNKELENNKEMLKLELYLLRAYRDALYSLTKGFEGCAPNFKNFVEQNDETERGVLRALDAHTQKTILDICKKLEEKFARSLLITASRRITIYLEYVLDHYIELKTKELADIAKQ